MPSICKTLAFDQAAIKFSSGGAQGIFEGYASVFSVVDSDGDIIEPGAFDDVLGNDVVALDGLEKIAGNREDEIALFDFHNAARTRGVGVLYAASMGPDELDLVLPDLRSRLQQCARIVLSPLDDEGRAEVLRDRAQRRGLILEDAAIDWLLTRTGRDLGALIALLEKLDQASLATQRRVTVPFLRKVLEASL